MEQRPDTLNDYQQRIINVLVYIDQHKSNPLTAEYLANIACFSPFHFHRLFHAFVRESLYSYIKRLRLEQAALQLQNSDLSDGLSREKSYCLYWSNANTTCRGNNDDEPASIKKMEGHGASNNRDRENETPREIYMSDPTKVDQTKMETVLRFKIIWEAVALKTNVIGKYLSALSSEKPTVKYPAAKKLVEIAEKNPELLYPHLEFFVKLSKGENNILKWNAIEIIGRLSYVDKENRVDGLLKNFVYFLKGEKLITANHSISALSHVALAKPKYQKRITKELLKCEIYKYETDECHNIVMGKVVQALGSYLKIPNIKAHVLEFVKRQVFNKRPATRKKAKRFLAKIRVETN